MKQERRREIQRIVFLTAISVFIDQRKKRTFKKKQIKRFWRRSIFRDRKLHSEYYTLYLNLRNNDREFHYRYLRMSKERFDHLLSMVRHKITKKNTQLRESISAEERLVIILGYLTTGTAQQDLSITSPLPKSTVLLFLLETLIFLFKTYDLSTKELLL